MQDMSIKVTQRDKIKDKILRANATLPDKDYAFPLYVIVESTNICNLNCIMCPSDRQKRERGVMSMQMWKKIMNEVAEKSPQSLIWPAIMGEALTASDVFYDMLKYSREKDLKIIWNTNAELLNDEWINKILDLKLQEISIGIDATTSNTYSQIRCGGNFNRVISNVTKLLDRNKGNTRITVQFIEQEANFEEKDDFKEIWLSKGAFVKIRPRLGWGDGVDAPDLILRQNERVGPCPWIIRTISIHWNGIAVQCDGDWDQRYPVGDLSKNTIEEIWNGELAKRRKMHRHGKFGFDPCQYCNDWQAGLSDYLYPKEKIR